MAYTMEDARQVVLDNLDDETGARFARTTGTNTTDYTRIDRALRGALSSMLDEYTGDRFDEQIEVSTSATDGTVGLASYDIAKIKHARVALSTTATYALPGADVGSGGLPDRTARNLTLTIVRLFPIPPAPDATDLLCGVVEGRARSWDAFDELVCARAADALGAKTDETRAAIQRSIARLSASVTGQQRNPRSKPWPARETDPFYLSGRLRWVWTPRTQTMQLLFTGRGIG